MRISIGKQIFLFILLIVVHSWAGEMPLVYDVENTGADCPTPYLPAITELPTVSNLPDPFEWSDGRGRVAYFDDWEYRRAEIKAEIEHYEIGIKPDRPDSITATYEDVTLTVNVTVNGKTLILTSPITLPEGTGPFPAIIGINFGSGSLPSTIFSSRNIAQIAYIHDQVSTYGNPQNTNPYYQLYPDLNISNTGQYSAWAWGVSRLIDGLELVQDVLPIDLEHLAVTGCSYAGKLALFAGAFDERIALTISQESGGGGYTTWRYSEEINKTESVETLGKTDYNWFMDGMKQFSTAVSKLPEDHHELMAMVAPRALFVTGNPGWTWLADESGYVGSKAAKEVYKALGIPDRFGYSQIGGHNHCAVPNDQIPEIESFVDKFLLGIENADTDVGTSPYATNLSPWITWDTPLLTDGISFFEKPSLIYPPNLEIGLDTSVTLTWNQLDNANQYLVELSTNSAFTDIIVKDSTADTTMTVTGLAEGTRYYWRIRAEDVAGSLGPRSDRWNFATKIELPAKPQLVSATLYRENRPSYLLLTWNKALNASTYLVQASIAEDFSSLLLSSSTADTFKVFNGSKEGKKYFWRIQAKNVSGESPWSDASNITVILPPSDLSLEKTAPNEITLSWTDNSKVEDGYIIERLQSPQTTFTVIDTVTDAQYIDQSISEDQGYTYRVKAYIGSESSTYSNKVAYNMTGVQNEVKIPKVYSLSQNYPNPFNPVTKIRFALPKESMTKISVYDLLGREIRTLVNQELNAGDHEVLFDASHLSSGVYFYKIQAGDFSLTKKMILME